MTPTFPLGAYVHHAKKPEWGVGLVTALSAAGDVVEVVFSCGPSGGARRFVVGALNPAAPVDPAVAAALAALAKPAPSKALSKGLRPKVHAPSKASLEPAAPTPRQLIERFLKMFPLGFRDPVYCIQERGDVSRRSTSYRAYAIGEVQQLCEAERLERAAAGQDPEFGPKLLSGLSLCGNLLAGEERRRRDEMLRGHQSAQRFAQGLQILLCQPEVPLAHRWDAYLDHLPDACREKWPIASLVPSLAAPRELPFVKPSLVKLAAESVGTSLASVGAPSGDGIERILAIFRSFEQELEARHQTPRDLHDVYAFFFKTLSSASMAIASIPLPTTTTVAGPVGQYAMSRHAPDRLFVQREAGAWGVVELDGGSEAAPAVLSSLCAIVDGSHGVYGMPAPAGAEPALGASFGAGHNTRLVELAANRREPSPPRARSPQVLTSTNVYSSSDGACCFTLFTPQRQPCGPSGHPATLQVIPIVDGRLGDRSTWRTCARAEAYGAGAVYAVAMDVGAQHVVMGTAAPELECVRVDSNEWFTVRTIAPGHPTWFDLHPTKPWIASFSRNAISIVDIEQRALRQVAVLRGGWTGCFVPEGDSLLLFSTHHVGLLELSTGVIKMALCNALADAPRVAVRTPDGSRVLVGGHAQLTVLETQPLVSSVATSGTVLTKAFRGKDLERDARVARALALVDG